MIHSDYVYLFDLDGTISSREILPVIAREIGIETEMKQLTEMTMAGELPFDHCFRKRVETLKQVPIKKVQDIISKVPISEEIFHFIQDARDHCCVVTGNLDVWVEPVRERLGIPFYTSEAEVIANEVVGVKNIIRKVDVLKNFNKKLVAIGDGFNDLEFIENADIGIAYGGVHPPAKALLEVATHSIHEDKALCRFLRQLS